MPHETLNKRQYGVNGSRTDIELNDEMNFSKGLTVWHTVRCMYAATGAVAAICVYTLFLLYFSLSVESG